MGTYLAYVDYDEEENGDPDPEMESLVLKLKGYMNTYFGSALCFISLLVVTQGKFDQRT